MFVVVKLIVSNFFFFFDKAWFLLHDEENTEAGSHWSSRSSSLLDVVLPNDCEIGMA